MRNYTFLSILACVPLLILSSPVGNKRVVDGKIGDPHQFPYLALVVTTYYSHGTFDAHPCGGTILSTKTVLTAADCYTEDEFQTSIEFHVVVGALYAKSDPNHQRHKVARFTMHPQFNFSENLKHNIAIIETKSEMQFSAYVSPILLEQRYVGEGLDVIASGVGGTEYADYSDIPRYLNLATITNDECRKLTPQAKQPILDDFTLCASRTSGYLHNKDEGGPLVYDGFLIGVSIHNFNSKNETVHYFTRVSAYISWIDKNTV